jgi:hypothetical protein
VNAPFRVPTSTRTSAICTPFRASHHLLANGDGGLKASSHEDPRPTILMTAAGLQTHRLRPTGTPCRQTFVDYLSRLPEFLGAADL